MMVDLSSHNLFRGPPRDSFCDAAAAILLLDDGRYLMQLRDDKPGIFYPDHWGLFGGGVEEGESSQDALHRELQEELSYDFDSIRYFTKMDFCFESIGAKNVVREFYEVPLKSDVLSDLHLGEGRALKAMSASELLLERRVVPYDSFAIWMHYSWVGHSGNTLIHKTK